VRENIGVNFGFIEELSKTPGSGERGKQTLYKSKLLQWWTGRVGIERVFFFENNNRTRIAVEMKTTLINTSLLRSHRNKSLMSSIFFVCFRWVIAEKQRALLWHNNIIIHQISTWWNRKCVVAYWLLLLFKSIMSI